MGRERDGFAARRRAYVPRPDGFASPRKRVQAFPKTAAALGELIGGWQASAIYTHDQSSGASVDHIGGVNLTPQGTPTLNVATGYGADRGVTMADNTAQRLEASANTVFDQASDSFAWLCVLRLNATPAATRHLLQKIGASFYSLRLPSTGKPEFAAFDGAIQRTAPLTGTYTVGQFHCLVFGVNRTSGQVRCASRTENVATAVSGLGSLSNTGTFAIGRSSVSAPQTHTYSARFVDAQAEGVLANASTVISRFFQGQP